MHEGQRIVQEERPILGDQAIHDQDADKGIEVQRIIGQEEQEQGADEAQGQREHADEWRLDRFIEDGQDHEYQDERQEQGFAQVREGRRHLVGLAGEAESHAVQVHGVQVIRHVLDDLVQRPSLRRAAEGDAPFLVGPADRHRSCPGLDLGYVGDVNDVAVGVEGNRFQVGQAEGVGPFEADVDIRVVVVVFGVIGQDAGFLAADGIGKGVVQIAQGRAVLFQLITVDDELVFGHAVLVGAADVAQAGDVGLHHLFDSP